MSTIPRPTAPLRERLRHAYLQRVVVPGLRLSGTRIADGLARRVGRGLFRLGPPIREIALTRAGRALGDTQTHADIVRIVEASFEHAARFWSESLFVRRQLATGDWRRYIQLQSGPTGTSDDVALATERMQYVRRSDSGVIFTSACLGNPVVAAVVVGRILGRIHVVADFANRPMMNAWARDLDGLPCINIIDRSNAATRVPDLLDAGESIFMIGEHARQGGRGVRTRWLGNDVTAYRTIGLLAARHNATVVPLACTRNGDTFRFTLELEPSIEPINHAGDPDTIVRATITALERTVRRMPEQYLWAMQP